MRRRRGRARRRRGGFRRRRMKRSRLSGIRIGYRM